MSVIVALKDKDNIYVGCDSQITAGRIKRISECEGCRKVFTPRGVNNALMGVVGSSNVCQYLQGQYLVPENVVLRDEIDIDFLSTEFNWHLYDLLDNRGLLPKSEDGTPDLGSTCLFAYRDKLYEISSDLFVFEYKDFCALGSGKQAALGSLYSTEGKDPIYRILKAIKCSKNIDVYVNYPIVISNTKTNEFNVYYKEDIEAYLKGEFNQ